MTRGFEKISLEQFEKDFETYSKPLSEHYKDIRLPKRATALSACYDVFLPYDIKLEPNENVKIPTGIKSYMLDDEVLLAYPRSGHGFKYFIRIANTTPIIDADYIQAKNEGHIWIKIRNEGNKVFEIKKGDAFVQLMFQKYLLADGDNFDGEQRTGGFGSTDK